MDNEAKWAAEADAHTLAEAEAIKSDAKRLKAAQTAAKRMASEQQERADNFRVIAGSSSGEFK